MSVAENVRTLQLWLVYIDEDDWNYDIFERAVVWADSPEQAEQIVRASVRTPAGAYAWQKEDEPWIDPKWKLHVEPAPAEGVALVHWHAG